MPRAGTPALPPTCLAEVCRLIRGSASLRTVVLWAVAFSGLSEVILAAEQLDYEIVDLAIPRSLTGTVGDPERGERIVRDADNATCLICHAIPIKGEPDPGNIGPPLDGVGSRYTAGELRLRLVEPQFLNPETVMPSYYRSDGLHRVAAEYEGRTVYDASEIEDVIAYLMTLVED